MQGPLSERRLSFVQGRRGEEGNIDLSSATDKTNTDIFTPCLCLCNHCTVCVSSLLKQRAQSECFIVALLHIG